MQILLVQFEISPTFHFHMNMSKHMTELVTELVEIVHFFNIVNSFSVQGMWS